MEVLLKRWIAHDGDRTLIAEVDARQVPGAQNDYCLIHETDMTMRRLWRYPQDWNQLDDAKLLALFEAPLAGTASGALAGDARPARTRAAPEANLPAALSLTR